MKIYYKLLNTAQLVSKAIRLSKEPIYCETDNPIQIIFDIPLAQRKKQWLLSYTINGKAQEKRVKHNEVITLERVEKPLKIKMSLSDGVKKYEVDGIEIRSLAELTEELVQALPDFAALPLKIKQLEEKQKTTDKLYADLVNKLNDDYAKAIEALQNRIRLLEGAYSLDEI